MPFKDPNQRREYSRYWQQKKYWTNREKALAYNKEYWKNTTEERIFARKCKKLEYTRIARKKHPDAPQIYYKRNKDKWTNGADCRDPEIWKKAEMVAEELIKKLGYTDIFKSSFRWFYFDLLAKNADKTCAFQITTLRARSIKRKHIELASYLGLDFFVVHVKPTFDVAYISKIVSEFPKQNKDVINYHFAKGIKHTINSSFS